jgi:hypothetical protein
MLATKFIAIKPMCFTGFYEFFTHKTHLTFRISGADYTLCIFRLIRPSQDTHEHLVVEPFPYPIIADLGTWLRITQSLTLLPLGSTINRVPSLFFNNEVVVRALRDFPNNLDVLHINPFWIYTLESFTLLTLSVANIEFYQHCRVLSGMF